MYTFDVYYLAKRRELLKKEISSNFITRKWDFLPEIDHVCMYVSNWLNAVYSWSRKKNNNLPVVHCFEFSKVWYFFWIQTRSQDKRKVFKKFSFFLKNNLFWKRGKTAIVLFFNLIRPTELTPWLWEVVQSDQLFYRYRE